MTIKIRVPKTVQQLDEVRLLMRDFVKWHGKNNPAESGLIEQYFETGEFEKEIDSLPGKYAPPHGQLLYATWEEAPAGCVALRKLDATTCEMKRMYVYPEFHGKGMGRALAQALLEQARAMKFQRMLLDTSVGQLGAIRLYQRLGFRMIDPYYELPQSLRDWLVFMELEL